MKMNTDHSSSSFKTLLQQFESTKKELGDAEENIRRLTGRDPENFNSGDAAKGQFGLNKRRPQQLSLPDKPFPGRKRPLFPIVKAKEDQTIQEDSPDEDETPVKKPSLPSTVVATPKDLKSRRETIQEQNVNSKVKARNRRMFGMILGTLQKFQHDAKKREEKDMKRAEIEQKVEAAAAEEKERIKKEKEEFFQIRREKQAQLRCLEKKIEIAELHEVWENNQKYLLNFIVTKTEPSICFLPAKHSSKTAKCLEMSRKNVMDRIQERRQNVEKALSEVEEMYKKNNFPSDKENIGPLEDEGLNELIDSSDGPTDRQQLPDAQSEAQESHKESEINEMQESQISCNMTKETDTIPQVSEEINHEASTDEFEKVPSDGQLSCVNSDENKVNEQTDQDFEPIYD